MNSPSLDVSTETLVEGSTEDLSGLSYPDCTILRPSRKGEMEGPGRRLVSPPGPSRGEGACLTSAALFRPSYNSSSSDNRRVRAGLQRSKGCKQRQPFTEAWWRRWVGAGGRQPAKARRRRLPALPPHPKNPHAPSYTDRNRKTEALILGGTAAATFPTSLHTLAAGSRTTWPGLPQLPDCTELPGPPSPHTPSSVLFMLSGPGSQDASGSNPRASGQVWSLECL